MQDWQGIVAATLRIARLKDIRDIALFNAIVACGSLSAPGRQLGLSLAVVSKSLTQMEQQLGVRLFVDYLRKALAQQWQDFSLTRPDESLLQAGSQNNISAAFLLDHLHF